MRMTFSEMEYRGGSSPKHHWLESERDIVRRDYDGTNKSAQLIAENLSHMTGECVTLNAVKGQVSKLGLAIDKSRRWTPKETDALTEMITEYAPLTIAKKLHRSVNSVVLKSKRLGLSRRVRNDWYTQKEVCEILGVDHRKVGKWIEAQELKASYHHGHKPQKNGSGYWHIERKDLRDFIQNNSHGLVGRNVDLFQIVDILSYS